jgi:hypothetical protein
LQFSRQPQPCGTALQTTITADFVLGKTGNRSAVALEGSICECRYRELRLFLQEKPSPPRDCKAGVNRFAIALV